MMANERGKNNIINAQCTERPNDTNCNRKRRKLKTGLHRLPDQCAPNLSTSCCTRTCTDASSTSKAFLSMTCCGLVALVNVSCDGDSSSSIPWQIMRIFGRSVGLYSNIFPTTSDKKGGNRWEHVGGRQVFSCRITLAA